MHTLTYTFAGPPHKAPITSQVGDPVVCKLLADYANLSTNNTPFVGGSVASVTYASSKWSYVVNIPTLALVDGTSAPGKFTGALAAMSAADQLTWAVLNILTPDEAGGLTLTGDVLSTPGSTVTTLKTLAPSVAGTYGGALNAEGATTARSVPVITVDAKGRVTAASSVNISPPPDLGEPNAGVLTNCTGLPVATGISGLGDGIADMLANDMDALHVTALATPPADNGSPVLKGFALGQPVSGSLINCTKVGIASLCNGVDVSQNPIALGNSVLTLLATNLGAGVTTALGVAPHLPGGMALVGGSLGAPSSGTLTNCTGLPPSGVVGTAATISGSEVLINKSYMGSSLAVTGAITSTGVGAAGIGYAAGAGGTATQLSTPTNVKTNSVTLNKVAGTITTNNAALAAATSVSFTFNNDTIAADDMVIMQIVTGPATVGSYAFRVVSANGYATITIRNTTAGSLSEAIVFKFIVFKSAIT